ncbi:MAG: hypothetical protein JRH14_02535 [Deltaproteobacteria bacterium]|nr:hypothetical protein [Deltaproteobacteria bacterium]
MARLDFKLPDIGEGVTEGEIVDWFVAGRAGDPYIGIGYGFERRGGAAIVHAGGYSGWGYSGAIAGGGAFWFRG